MELKLVPCRIFQGPEHCRVIVLLLLWIRLGFNSDLEFLGNADPDPAF
jgi:hypothetical protein